MTTIAWGVPSQTRTSHIQRVRPAGSRSIASAPAAPAAPLVLTRRGRVVLAVLVLVLVAILGGLFANRASADGLGEPVKVAVHSVGAGETLWQIAAAVTPAGADVRDTIDEVLELNTMSSVDLTIGQQLLVPQR